MSLLKFFWLSCVLALCPVAWCAPTLSSLPSVKSVSGSGDSWLPRFSPDSTKVVFVSAAKDLVPNDDLGRWLDVFLLDLASSNTVLVSVNTNDVGGGNSDTTDVCLSSNGNIVVFVSRASNLVAGDTNETDDVFWRDMANGQTHLASAMPDGRSPDDVAPYSGLPLSSNPFVSANGGCIFFESRATNLTSVADTNRETDIFRRATASNVLVPVSVNTAATAMAAGRSSLHGISADGKRALISSAATDLTAGVTTNALHLRDVDAGTTIWAGTNYPLFAQPILSEDGNVVAFVERSYDPTTGLIRNDGNLVRVDIAAGTTQVLGLASNLVSGIQINIDGTTVAFTDAATAKLAVWRQTSGVTFPSYGKPVAVSADGSAILMAAFDGYPNQGDRDASGVTITGFGDWFELIQTNGPGIYVGVGTPSDVAGASLSRDGTLVVYSSTWQVTSLGDRNASSDIFIRRTNGIRELLSKAHANRRSASPAAHTGLSPAGISGDGRFIVATRDDDPSFAADTNHQTDVFLTDLNTGMSHAISTVVRVTTNSTGALQTNSFISTNGCLTPVISADGSTIAAIQRINDSANSLDVVLARGTNGMFALGLESLRATVGVFPGSYFSPSLTSDGRLLAFASTATGLTPEPDVNGTGPDIFVLYEPTIHEPSVFLISRSTNGLTGNTGATNPVISPDGRWVTFVSQASTLVHPILRRTNAIYPSFTTWPYNSPQLFAADLGTNRNSTNFLREFPLRLCSYTLITNRGGSSFPDPSMSFTTLRPLDTPVVRAVTSANGRYVVFATTNPAAIYRHDLNGWRTNWFEEFVDTGGQPALQLVSGLEPGTANSLVCEDCSNPSVSADGNLIAYEKPRVGMSGYDVYVTDVSTGTTTLANATPAGVPANASSTRPLISGDGRYVVFQSKASNIVLNDTNAFTDIFVRDRQLGQTILVSANLLGGSGNGPSSSPVLGIDGRTVVFRSSASDLVPDDFNDRRDLMVLKLGGTDSDSDTLDDQWEVAFFGDLSRTGAADYDSDGVSDRDEFLAGTDPTNSGSIFKLLVLSTAEGGSRRLLWTGDPSRSYRVECKDDLNSPDWSGLSSTITWSGPAAVATDNSPGTNRFYRVVRLP